MIVHNIHQSQRTLLPDSIQEKTVSAAADDLAFSPYIAEADEIHIHEMSDIVGHISRIIHRLAQHGAGCGTALIASVCPQANDLILSSLDVAAAGTVSCSINPRSRSFHFFIDQDAAVHLGFAAIQKIQVSSGPDSKDNNVGIQGFSFKGNL